MYTEVRHFTKYEFRKILGAIFRRNRSQNDRGNNVKWCITLTQAWTILHFTSLSYSFSYLFLLWKLHQTYEKSFFDVEWHFLPGLQFYLIQAVQASHFFIERFFYRILSKVIFWILKIMESGILHCGDIVVN